MITCDVGHPAASFIRCTLAFGHEGQHRNESRGDSWPRAQYVAPTYPTVSPPAPTGHCYYCPEAAVEYRQGIPQCAPGHGKK